MLNELPITVPVSEEAQFENCNRFLNCKSPKAAIPDGGEDE